MNFKFLDHPADVGFVARGKTLEETFAAAALALCAFGWELKNVRLRASIEIRARAATLEDLLFSWLSEVLFLADAEQWLFRRFKVHAVRKRSEKERPLTTETQSPQRTADDARARIAATEFPAELRGPRHGEHSTVWELQATARGEKFDQKRHRSRTYIKAVTYHQLSVKETRGGFEATVFLDV